MVRGLMRCEVLIVTYLKDLPWLNYALRSIERFGSGFSGVTVVYPLAQEKEFVAGLDALISPFFLDRWVRLISFDEFPGKGMLHHMHEKMIADLHCPEADFILHFDSDQIFREPVRPEDYFVDGRPRLLKEPYDILAKTHPGRHYWKAITEDALGFETPFETMCCPCQVYPRWLYPLVRNHVAARAKAPFLYWMLMGQNAFPQDRCEHNTMGGFAHHFHRDEFHWIEVPRESRPRDKAIQAWSHGALDQPQEIWLDGEQTIVVPRILFEKTLK